MVTGSLCIGRLRLRTDRGRTTAVLPRAWRSVCRWNLWFFVSLGYQLHRWFPDTSGGPFNDATVRPCSMPRTPSAPASTFWELRMSFSSISRPPSPPACPCRAGWDHPQQGPNPYRSFRTGPERSQEGDWTQSGDLLSCRYDSSPGRLEGFPSGSTLSVCISTPGTN